MWRPEGSRAGRPASAAAPPRAQRARLAPAPAEGQRRGLMLRGPPPDGRGPAGRKRCLSADGAPERVEWLAALAFLLDPDEPHDGQADQRARDRLERGHDRRVVLAGDREAVDDQAEDDRAQEGADERADDPGPEAIGQEDREVPQG